MVPIKLAKPSVPMRVKLITATKIELILVPRHVACSRYKAASNRLGRSNQLQTHEMITAQCHLHCITEDNINQQTNYYINTKFFMLR